MSARQLNRLAKAKGKDIDPLLPRAFNEEYVEESEEESEEEPELSLVSAAAAVSDSDRIDNQYSCTSGRQRNTLAQPAFLALVLCFLGCHPVPPAPSLPCVFGARPVCCVFVLMSSALRVLILFRNRIFSAVTSCPSDCTDL